MPTNWCRSSPKTKKYSVSMSVMMVPFESWCGWAWRAKSRSIMRSNSAQQVIVIRLLNRARAFDAHVGLDNIAVDMTVEVDHVRLGGVDQHRRMRGADDAEVFLVHQFLEHFQGAVLVGNRERHLRLVQQQAGAVGQFGEGLAKHREHYLAVAGHAQELEHLRLSLEEFELGARIVLLGIEQVALADLDAARIQTVDVPLHGFAAERVVDGMEERRLAGTVIARQHDQRMREIHDHRHMEVETGEDRVRNNLQIHRS